MIAWILVLGCGSEIEPAETRAEAGEDFVVQIGEPALFDGSSSMGADALWDFGDGSQKTGFSAEHVYQKPGRYSAVLQVTGEDGLKKTDSVRVVAHLPLADSSPVWSASMAVDSETGAVWVVCPEDDALAVVSPDSGELIRVPTCDGPRNVAIDESVGRVLVSCDRSDSLDVFDKDTHEHLSRIELESGARPFGVLARDGVWWSSLQGAGAVVRFDEAGVLERLDGWPDPRAIAMDPDGQVFATRWRSTDEQGWVSQQGADGISLALDVAPDSDTTSGGVPTQLDSLTISPDGNTLYVPGHQANLLRGEFLSGQALTFETSVRAVLRVIESGVESDTVAKLFDEKGHANFALPSLLGDLVYVLHPGTQSISILDAYSGVHAGSIGEVGHTPTALAWAPGGQVLYVHAWLDRLLIGFDVSDLSSPPKEVLRLPVVEQEPLSEEVLSGKRVFYSSADPRMAKSGYISCGHCHPDGRDDGIVWDFTDRGEGLRNTTSLEGLGSLPAGPLHWSGNFDEIQDFEQDIRENFGGQGFMSDEDWEATSDALGTPKEGLSPELDNLAAFVQSLDSFPVSPHRAPTGGQEAFERAGCARCHAGPDYTDSSLDTFVRHDVGTWTEASGQRRGEALDGFDTPSLLGVHATGPYLHDGSADSIEEAIEAHSGSESLDSDTLLLIADFVRAL